MSTTNNVTFEDSNFKIKSRVLFGKPEVPGIIKFLVKKGIVKNEKQAAIILIVLVLLLIGTSIFLTVKFSRIQPAIIDSSLISNK